MRIHDFTVLRGCSLVGVILAGLNQPGWAEFVSFRDETGADAAEAAYGATGSGTTVVIMDRGIDWDHPDFIRPDGTTRIRWIYDMSPDLPEPTEYSASQINAALAGGIPLATRDAVGHGTVTAGLAAGNGRAAGGGAFRGMAPDADLIVIKVTSDGAVPHDDQPEELPFVANYVDALDWLETKLDGLAQPAVGIFNSGVQWGPIDGTSPVSRRIDEVFGSNRPGRVYVAPSGDEGSVPNHAQAQFNNLSDAVIRFEKMSPQTTHMQMYYSGDRPAEISLTFDDGTTIGPVPPNDFAEQNGVRLFHYLPGADVGQFQSSTSGDRLVWVEVAGHVGPGTVRVRGLDPGEGTIDLYTPIDGTLTSPMPFEDHLVPGRLTDFAATESAIVAGAHVLLTEYTDINGVQREITGDGDPQALWPGSSSGPTRDGRLHGVDITAPGHNAFAAYAQESYWATLDFNEISGGEGWYGRGGATSGSAPIVVGAIALLLEAAPQLTADQVRDILRTTATSDAFTGATPNRDWGFGKLNVLAAIDEVCDRGWAVDGFCPSSLAADFDAGGDVDGDDFLTWQLHFGLVEGAARSDGDADADGDVDGEDFLVWQTQFGSAAGSGQRAVPEPLAAMLAGIALLTASQTRFARTGRFGKCPGRDL